MGLIKAAIHSATGAVRDSFLEVVEPAQTGPDIIACSGVVVNTKRDKKSQNKRGTANLISDGSVIHVGENQAMLLTDGGKIVDYTAESGYFTVDTGSAPSMFNGQFGNALNEAFARFKFGGTTPASQKVTYINTQEIRDIPFGTPNPINYFDNFYNAELYVRANGYFSVRVVNPLTFYAQVAVGSDGLVTTDVLQKSFLSEFLNALQTAINQMSAAGERISFLPSKGMELAKTMSNILDEDWTAARGILIESVGINSISYDESSKKLIEMRNQGAILSDPNIREGYIQGAAARGMEAAGSNAGGATNGFMGFNMAGQAAGSVISAASATNQQQAQQTQAANQNNTASQDSWTCSECGQTSTGNFCTHCGASKPQSTGKFCSNCGTAIPAGAKFCPNCGQQQ